MDVDRLPVQSRIVYEIMVLTYRAPNGEALDYIKSLLNPCMPACTLRSSDKPSLVAPRYNTKSYGAQAFSIFGPNEFNALPVTV